MKLAVLACLLAAAASAQRDPFVGVFQGDKITLELTGAGGKYSGTLTVQGTSLPASAVAAGNSANGSFEAGGRSYPFTLTPYGNGFKLASEGSEYLLAREVDGSSAPPAPAQSPAQPARDVPDL